MTALPDELVWSLGRVVPAAAATAGPDRGVTTLGALWSRTLDDTIARWQAEVSPLQQASIERQVEAAVHAQAPGDLTALGVPVFAESERLIEDAMRTVASAGAAAVVAEARTAGLELGAPPPLAAVTLATWARAAADLLAAGLSLGVAREALRQFRPGATAAAVTEGVRAYLGGLSDRPLRDVIGGALTRAQNLGRLQVYAGPKPPRWSVRLIADETLDERTCGPCAKIDHTELPSPDAAALAYGGGGYLFCQGGERCRGTVRGIWEREPDAAEYGDHADVLAPLGAALARAMTYSDSPSGRRMAR